VILFCGILSAIAGGGTDRFDELVKPAGTPPALIFILVWTVLYLAMGGAAGAVVGCRERAYLNDKCRGLLYFAVMMIFHFLWYPLFFGAGAFVWAFIDILILIFLNFFICCYFGRIFRICGAVFAVHILWLLYAAYLNLGILLLND